jgi:hypothetical protein
MNDNHLDEGTLALLKRSDPARHWKDADAQTLLSTDETLRFVQAQIESSQRSRSHRRRVMTFGALAIGVAAAGIVAVNVIDTGNGPVSHALHEVGIAPPSTAQASTVQTRALKALTPGSGQILDVDAITTQKNSNGTSERWGYRYWSSTTYPYPNRVIQTQDGQSQESALASDGYQELYDPSTNTIYKYEPRFDVTPGSAPGTKILTVPSYTLIKGSTSPASSKLPPGDSGTTQLTVTAAQIAKLKTGADEIGYDKMTLVKDPDRVIGDDPSVDRNNGYAINPASQWGGPIRKLLHDPNSTVDTSATYKGRPAIKISRERGSSTITYWVAPKTYRPLREVLAGADGSDTTTFPTYRTLTGTAASPNLLALSAQHPSARLDTNTSDYEAAESRLFQNG